MKKLKTGTGFIIFILFFGVALVESFRDASWTRILFWMLMGAAFLVADNIKRPGSDKLRGNHKPTE